MISLIAFSNSIPLKYVCRSRSRQPRKRTRESEETGDLEDVEMGEGGAAATKKRALSKSREKSMSKRDPERARSLSKHKITARDASAYRDPQQKADAEVLAKKVQKRANQNTKASESDRRVYNDMPRHLFSGKRGIGKKDYR